MEERIKEYNKQFSEKNADEILAFFLDKFKNSIAFATSLGAEDQVITDLIYRNKTAGLYGLKTFTLDTGRLFNETLETLQYTNSRYAINIEVFFPDKLAVEKMVNKNGINLFYESIENRKLCCGIRKVDSIKRALEGKKAWITGVRREQSSNRNDMQLIEWDRSFGIMKINPLINWTNDDVWEYIKSNNVVYNSLHDKGFPSIGCMPCTRAVAEGENLRDGRWWWEQENQKECGLHSGLEKNK